MKLLHLDSSALSGNSVTRELTAAIVARWQDKLPQLQVEYEKVVEILLQRGAPAAQVAVAQRQSLLAERILGAVNTVLAGDENAQQAADVFGRDAARFGQVEAMKVDDMLLHIGKNICQHQQAA